MWKMDLADANVFSKQQTVSKMPEDELFSPDNSESGWDNVLLAQTINKRGGGGCNKNVLICFFEKNKLSGGTSIPDWRVGVINGPRTHRPVKPDFHIAVRCLRLPSIACDCLRLPAIACDCL